MAKFLFMFAIAIIIYIVVTSPEPNSISEAPEPLPTPIVEYIEEKIEEDIKDDIKDDIKELPIEGSEQVEISPTPTPQKSGLASLSLIGTIYGTSDPSAMLADRNGRTFIVKLNQNILRSDYKVIRIDKDEIYLERQGKTYRLRMSKDTR